MLSEILCVSGGAVIGGVGRHLLTTLLENKIHRIGNLDLSQFHVGTTTVNVIGSFIIGIIASLALELDYSKNLKFFLLPGLLASFTTFSSFTLYETEFLKKKEISYWLIYIGINIIGSLLLVYLGLFIGRKIADSYKKRNQSVS